MIYTVKEYATIKKVSHDTILKRIHDKQMPSDCTIKKLRGKRGAYIIETQKELR